MHYTSRSTLLASLPCALGPPDPPQSPVDHRPRRLCRPVLLLLTSPNNSFCETSSDHSAGGRGPTVKVTLFGCLEANRQRTIRVR